MSLRLELAPDATFVVAPIVEYCPLDRRIAVANPGCIGRLFDFV